MCAYVYDLSFNDASAMTASALQRDKKEVTFVLILSNQKKYSSYYNSSFVYISRIFIAKVWEMQY